MDGLEAKITAQMRVAMEADGLRQADLARIMTVLGFRWTENRVAQVLIGRGALSLIEIAGICAALNRPLAALLGEGEVEVPAGTPIPVDLARQALLSGDFSEWHARRSGLTANTGTGTLTAGGTATGAGFAVVTGAGTATATATATAVGWAVPHGELTIKAAKRLGVPPADVEVAAAELWGHGLPEERDRRVTPQQQETKRQLQARRGHAARALLAELRDYFDTRDQR